MRFFNFFSAVSLCSFFTATISTPTQLHRPTVYLVRHGEKPADPEDHYLNADGYKRAECLRTVFGKDSPYDIGYILAPRVKWNGDHRRSYDTVRPLALDLGLFVDTSCKRNRIRCLRKHIDRYDGNGNILISWRHGRMNEIAEELGLEDIPDYPEERFDIVWTIPFPYDNVTEIWSEKCPGLDDSYSPLRIQP